MIDYINTSKEKMGEVTLDRRVGKNQGKSRNGKVINFCIRKLHSYIPHDENNQSIEDST